MPLRALLIVTSPPDAMFRIGEITQTAGDVSATMDTGPHLAGADGRAAVGGLGVLVDNVLGYALMASLPPDTWSISTEIWLDLVGAIPLHGEVTATAEPRQEGSYAVGTVVDSDGRPVAECRQRGRRVAGGVPAPRPEGTAGGDGLGSPVGPAADFLGMTRAHDRDQLVVRELHANPRGMLHGGVSLAASEIAATRSRVDGGSLLPTSSIHIVHTRGVPVGATISFQTDTRHAGRTLWVSEVVGRVDGKVCTTATVTAQQ